MKKKFFLYEYLLEGLILAAAFTDYFPAVPFILIFTVIFGVVYWRDGLQPTTIYTLILAAAFLIGRAHEIPNINTYACAIVILLQYLECPVYNLPENQRLVGLRKQFIEEDGEEYFQLYPIAQNEKAKKKMIPWNQGKAFQKILLSKGSKDLQLAYNRIFLSYIQRITIKVNEGQKLQTNVGMAFCHGRDAAPFWYSTLLIHFASNGLKVGAQQHPNIASLSGQDKATSKQFREKELQRTAKQYYSTIMRLNCQKLVLVAHSYGCSALLQAYHDHKQLSSKVSHIILFDPYLFPLKNELLKKPTECPVLLLSNQYLLNFEDMYERHCIFTSKKNVMCIVWKEGSDLYQTDLCFLFSSAEKSKNWETLFQINLQAVNDFLQGKQIEGAFGDYDLGKKYKPESFLPEQLFIF